MAVKTVQIIYIRHITFLSVPRILNELIPDDGTVIYVQTVHTIVEWELLKKYIELVDV